MCVPTTQEFTCKRTLGLRGQKLSSPDPPWPLSQWRGAKLSRGESFVAVNFSILPSTLPGHALRMHSLTFSQVWRHLYYTRTHLSLHFSLFTPPSASVPSERKKVQVKESTFALCCSVTLCSCVCVIRFLIWNKSTGRSTSARKMLLPVPMPMKKRTRRELTQLEVKWVCNLNWPEWREGRFGFFFSPLH